MTPTLPLALLLWLQTCCAHYGVDPNFALAVAHVESRTQTQDFRFGRVGSVYLPMGIHKDFRARWPIDDPYVNIERGVRALRGDRQRVLRRYNREYTRAYGAAVEKARRSYARANVFPVRFTQ